MSLSIDEDSTLGDKLGIIDQNQSQKKALQGNWSTNGRQVREDYHNRPKSSIPDKKFDAYARQNADFAMTMLIHQTKNNWTLMYINPDWET